MNHVCAFPHHLEHHQIPCPFTQQSKKGFHIDQFCVVQLFDTLSGILEKSVEPLIFLFEPTVLKLLPSSAERSLRMTSQHLRLFLGCPVVNQHTPHVRNIERRYFDLSSSRNDCGKK